MNDTRFGRFLLAAPVVVAFLCEALGAQSYASPEKRRRDAPPATSAARPTIVLVFDSTRDTITVVTPVRPEKGVSAKAALAP